MAGPKPKFVVLRRQALDEPSMDGDDPAEVERQPGTTEEDEKEVLEKKEEEYQELRRRIFSSRNHAEPEFQPAPSRPRHRVQDPKLDPDFCRDCHPYTETFPAYFSPFTGPMMPQQGLPVMPPGYYRHPPVRPYKPPLPREADFPPLD
ncbi:MAG: hypothetical protein KVP17_004831 [Porospora cf. gigantea B]|uniref:uncharacterized protein n=1 Tax=Porospora cf. gigantea B TaxID=2853592 RepID=UPI003571B775|nr:MAG: hypothetical protein KVP17_004831 [Porospora cf. gigantea B]